MLDKIKYEKATTTQIDRSIDLITHQIRFLLSLLSILIKLRRGIFSEEEKRRREEERKEGRKEEDY